MILVALCNVTCTVKCHMHSDSDPSASVCVEILNYRHKNLSKVRSPSWYPAVPAADAIKLPDIRHMRLFALCVQM